VDRAGQVEDHVPERDAGIAAIDSIVFDVAQFEGRPGQILPGFGQQSYGAIDAMQCKAAAHQERADWIGRSAAEVEHAGTRRQLLHE